MQCQEVRELLSRYYDDELPADQSLIVAAHLTSCAACTAELETLHKLSELAERLEHPVAPRQVWSRIEAQLPVTFTAQPPEVASRLWSPLVKFTAVLVLLMLGVVWTIHSQRHDHGNHELAEHFGKFLDRFESAPLTAIDELMQHYSGQETTVAEATRMLKYRPVVADGLPADYELAHACLLKMPCCLCLQACYRRNSGGMVCVFEHDEDQPVWFGDRPQSSKVCAGRKTRIVDIDGSLAATWRQQRRYVSIIGAKDVDEVSLLIAHLDDRKDSSRLP